MACDKAHEDLKQPSNTFAMKPLFLFITFLLLISSGFAQTVIPLKEVGTMNDIVSEPSGLKLHYNTSNGHFEYWTHNDKGNQDSIYSFQIDDLSTMKRIVDLNVDWVDWEDMTADDTGNIYIGDFGNFNAPDELQIVKMPDPNSFSGNPLAVEIIEYVYPFSGISDTEAMFHHSGYIYTFSKSVSTNSNPDLEDGITYCFRIPDYPAVSVGEHVAELVGTFQTKLVGDTDPGTYRVTAADVSPDKRKVVLMTYERVWVFSCFEDANFFGGTVSHFDVNYRQYEGVSFMNNHEILITKEGSLSDPNYNPKLFYVDLYPWIDGSCIDCEKVRNGGFNEANFAWSKFLYGTGDATLTVTGGKAEMDIHTLGTSLWHINMRHKSLVLETGKTYRISYMAYAENDRPISVILNNRAGDTGYAYFGQDITTVPTYYTHEFTMTEATNYTAYFRGVLHTPRPNRIAYPCQKNV